MERTYVYGYSGARYTRGEIEGMSNYRTLNPEVRRRLWALMDADPTGSLGVGSAWRSRARAQQLYEDYRAGRRSAPAAPPDRTYHCEKNDGYCYAADMVGSLRWMNAHAHRFGLRHFADVNEEPWHVQPIEIPTSCSSRFQGVVLPTFPLPGGSTDDTSTITEGERLMATAEDFHQISEIVNREVNEAIRWAVLNEDGSAGVLAVVLQPIIDREVNEAIRWAVQNEDGSPGLLVALIRQQINEVAHWMVAELKAALPDNSSLAPASAGSH